MSKETKTSWDAIEVREQRSGAGKSCTVWPSPCRVASVRKRMTVVEIKTAFGVVEMLEKKAIQMRMWPVKIAQLKSYSATAVSMELA